MDTYEFTRRGLPGTFRVQAKSIDDARRLATEFFKMLLSDYTWQKTIRIESCMGCEDIPEPSDEEVAQMLEAADKH